ncbi:MAG TPA: ATP-dependent Clp protease adaptor ClpS [Fimbriiglobus sp.]|jgi:ATP-dependent Clp protease adapter protein ClpS
MKTHPARQAIRKVKLVLLKAENQNLIAVVNAVMDLTHYGREEAMYRMWQAYHTGRCPVLITHLERAELYVEQFADRGLRAMLEPA